MSEHGQTGLDEDARPDETEPNEDASELRAARRRSNAGKKSKGGRDPAPPGPNRPAPSGGRERQRPWGLHLPA